MNKLNPLDLKGLTDITVKTTGGEYKITPDSDDRNRRDLKDLLIEFFKIYTEDIN